MANFVFAPSPQAAVPVRGQSSLYAVSRIFCVGRNYEAHAREMGSDPSREPPFYFTKPANALLHAEGLGDVAMAYPAGTQNLHFEMELVIAIGKPVYKADVEHVSDAVYAVACGLDMTRRDLQNEAKKTGRPWDLGKAFEQSAVIGDLMPVTDRSVLGQGTIALSVNGQPKQSSNLTELIWSVPEIVANLSQFYHLEPGDLIYTGTPEGVGAVVPGDVIVGSIDGIGQIRVTITNPA